MISARLELASQGDDVVVFPVVLVDAAPDGVDVWLLDEQGHPARELSLNAAGRGGDPVRKIVLVQQRMQRQALLIVGKQDIIPQNGLGH